MKITLKTIFPRVVLSLLIVDFGIRVPSAYSQTRALTEGIEQLLRFAAKHPPNINIQRAYEIVRPGVALVTTANGVYTIYVDCKRGASESITYLPQDQQVSLIRDMCSNF
jgi:hypothetical protein